MTQRLARSGTQSIADLLDAQSRQTKAAINCVKIGIIRAFSPETQRAEIEIAYKQVESVNDQGIKVYQDYPKLLDCPVITLFGGVDFLSMPIEEGDTCLVLFNDNEIDQWATNGTGSPQTFRTHDLSDGIAIVGLRPLTNAIAGYLANGIRLSHGGGDSQIDLKDGLIETIAELFLHHGNMRIEGNLHVEGNYTIEGTTYGNAGSWTIDADIQQVTGRSIHAGNGATGTFNTVTVVDGIVIGGS